MPSCEKSGSAPDFLRDSNDQHRQFRIRIEPLDRFALLAKRRLDLLCAHIAEANPDHLRRVALNQAALLVVRVLGDDCEPAVPGLFPDLIIERRAESDKVNVRRARVVALESRREARGEVLVEQKLQADEASECRSRSAAYARHA